MRSKPLALRLPHLFSLALILVANAVRAVASTDCNLDPGTTSVVVLQQARARLRSTHPTTFGRADCARDMAASLETPAPCGETCLRELVGLFKDAAVYERRARDASRTAANRKDYAEREMKVRSKLHDLLKGEAKAMDADGEELRRNFAELADIYELEGRARGYHELISGDEIRATLGPKAFEVWARALRSCSQWEFTAGRDRDRPMLRRKLCADDCRSELKKLEDTLPLATVEARTKAANLVPTIAECSSEP